MEASKKLVAVFLVCIVVFSLSVHVSKADEESNAEKFKQAYETDANEYTVCVNDCEKECSNAGFGHTHCEMKCDTECNAKLLKERIEKLKTEKP